MFAQDYDCGFYRLLVVRCAASPCSSGATRTPCSTPPDAKAKLVYYASMNLAEANALIGEFEKRYPFIKVKLNRTGSEKLLTRVLTEARAKKIFRRRHSNRRIQHAYSSAAAAFWRATSPQANSTLSARNLKKRGFGRRSTTTPT